ncbi:hypothetical protein Tsubulata_023767 [Turnera subulata]|uniref:F-box domain-containing protein n=1 Tax=Turnera subulata TaxID=218843 RepID=A0A9Q0F685_9ROSI|nr:hypothetical protein Tsubulata_016449 [Turnera subulata]KAJ4824436.1 hypothetical protein Tsubulata_023767 [Turnera subulata]
MGAANLRLPSEIVEEILALLPQQSIHRFRSVSKSWSSLLVSVEFHKLRSRSSPPEITVQKLLHNYFKKYPDGANPTGHRGLGSLDFRNGQSKNDEVWFPTARDQVVGFVGSCNGLVCVTQPAGLDHLIRDITVWNPFTGVCRKLPNPEYTSAPDDYGFGHDSVREDYKAEPVANGFGHDSVGDDYKVFVAAHRPYAPAREVEFQIFSLKAGSWRKLEILSGYLQRLQLIEEGGRGLYLNGALHWGSRSGEKIIAFDLVEEKFSDVRAPVLEDQSYEHVSMGIVGEYLCMCWRTMGKKIVWMMKEYGNWVPFIQYSELGLFGSGLVEYECNFIPPRGGYMMLYFRLYGGTAILQWSNNDGEADAVDQGGRKRCMFYEKGSCIPYTEALTSPYPTASEVDFRT